MADKDDRRPLDEPEFDPAIQRTPPSVGFAPRTSSGAAFLAEVDNSWWMQAAARAGEMVRFEDEEGFDPLTKENLTGYEEYATSLAAANSSRELDAMKRRIDKNLERKEIINRDGTWWTGFAAGVLDPINIVPVPLATGVGALRGALLGGAANGALAAATEYGALQIDPTRTMTDVYHAAGYGALFGGLIGGGVGAYGARSAAKLGRLYLKEQQLLDEALGAHPIEAATPEMQQAARVGAGGIPDPQGGGAHFDIEHPIRPTEAGDTVGIAPAFGLEKLTGRISPVTRLVQSGIQAVSDLALGMGGDFGFMTKDALNGKKAVPSALLRSGKWNALAADMSLELKRAYNAYLGRADAAQPVGIDLAGSVSRLGDRARGMLGRGRRDGRMSFEEFKDAVFRSHRTDRLEVPADVDPRARPFIEQSLPYVRGFFDDMKVALTNTGQIKTPEFRRREMGRGIERRRDMARRLDELRQKLDKTENDKAMEVLTARELARLTRFITDKAIRYHLSKASDERLHEIADGIRRQGETRRQELLDDRLRQADEMQDHLETLAAMFDHLVEREQGGSQLTPEELAMREDIRQALGLEETRELTPDEIDSQIREGFARRRKELAALPREQVERDIKEHLDHLLDRFGIDATQRTVRFTPDLVGPDGTPVLGQASVWKDHIMGLFQEALVEIRPGSHPEDMLASGLHEVGHILKFAIFDFFPEGEKAAFYADFEAWKARNGRASTRYMDARPISMLEKDLGDLKTTLQTPFSKLSPEMQGYLHDFDEWFADRAAEWLMRHDEPVTAMDKFFKGIADIWRTLFHFTTGEQGSPASIDRFMRQFGGYEKAGPRVDNPLDLPAAGSAVDQVRRDREVRDGADVGDGLTDRQRSYLKDLEGKIARSEIKFDGPKNEPFYLPRNWDLDAVLHDRAGLQAALADWEMQKDPGLRRDQAMDKGAKMVQAIIDAQAYAGDEPVHLSYKQSYLNKRALDVPNEIVAKWIDTDIDAVTHDYVRTAGPRVEMARQFRGDHMAVEVTADTLMQASQEIAGTADEILAQVGNMEREIHSARDHVLGRMRAGMPLTIDRVAAETAKNWVAVSALGKIILSATTEVVRPMMVRGFVNNFSFALEMMVGNMASYRAAAKDIRMLTGEGFDVARGMTSQRWMEAGITSGRPGSQAAMKADKMTKGFNNFANSTYFLLNGLASLTDILKNYTQVMSAHFMIQDIKDLANGVATAKQIKNMLALGIDAGDAKRMVDMPMEQTANGMNMPNLLKWTDGELQAKFASAVAGEVRRAIVTPGTADKSLIQQGFFYKGDKRREFALLTLPFQFMSWGIAANNKVLVSALQGRDASAWMGIVGMVGAGYLSTWMKTSDAAWDQMEVEDKIAAAVDQSGVLGSLGDLNNIIENGTMGMYGVRPGLGLEPKYGIPYENGPGALGVLGGPAGDKAFDLYRMFSEPDMDWGERGSIIRRSLPLNNLIYLDGLAKGFQRTLTDDLPY